MNIVSEDINQYCLEHSSSPSPLAYALEKETIETVPMAVMLTGPLVGSFLGQLIRATSAKKVVEVGTFTGYSALCMAENLPETGEVWTLDINPETVALGKKHWNKSPHGKKIHSLIGLATQNLEKIPGPVDFAFIDADKPGYISYVELILPMLSPKGMIVSDNCLWNGKVLDPHSPDPDAVAIRKFNQFMKNHPAFHTTLIPLRDGLMLAIRK